MVSAPLLTQHNVTIFEEEKRKDQARKTAILVGGTLALLLGLKRNSEQRVLWDEQALRFIVNGRFVSLQTVREAISHLELIVRLRIGRLTDQLAEGKITVDEWKNGVERVVASSHILVAALGLGSIAAAVKSSVVDRNITSETAFLTTFAKDIKTKGLSAAAIKARARSYFTAARLAYGNISLNAHKLTGFTEVKRVRTAAESCKGCVHWSGRWLPIDDMPPLGRLDCRNWCKCYFEFR